MISFLCANRNILLKIAQVANHCDPVKVLWRNAQAMNEALLSKPDFTGQAMDRFAFQLWQQLCRKAGTE